MRQVLAALALAGAFLPFAPARASEPIVRLAQMSRDVTDAVRRQRSQQHERSRARCDRATGEGRR